VTTDLYQLSTSGGRQSIRDDRKQYKNSIRAIRRPGYRITIHTRLAILAFQDDIIMLPKMAAAGMYVTDAYTAIRTYYIHREIDKICRTRIREMRVSQIGIRTRIGIESRFR